MNHAKETSIVIRMDKEETRALHRMLCDFIPTKGDFTILENKTLQNLKDILATY